MSIKSTFFRFLSTTLLCYGIFHIQNIMIFLYSYSVKSCVCDLGKKHAFGSTPLTLVRIFEILTRKTLLLPQTSPSDNVFTPYYTFLFHASNNLTVFLFSFIGCSTHSPTWEIVQFEPSTSSLALVILEFKKSIWSRESSRHFRTFQRQC